MEMIFDVVERRTLGVLMEKSATQPDYYPMTLNAIVAACNQKSNRDPVMDLDEDVVWDALSSLIERGLVLRILPPPGARTDKFKHEVASVLSWQSPQRAIMTELMLRGAQTVGELRTRCSRMTAFDNIKAVRTVLDSLENWTPALVHELPRSPGQSAVRFDHLLYPDEERAARGSTASVSSSPAERLDLPAGDVREELNALTDQVTELREAFSELRDRLHALENKSS